MNTDEQIIKVRVTKLSIKQDIIQKLYYDGYNEYVINLDDNTKSTR